MQKPKKLDMIELMGDPAYKGKHILIIAGQIFTARTGERMGKILDKMRKKYPKEIPEITYVPKADTLIL